MSEQVKASELQTRVEALNQMLDDAIPNDVAYEQARTELEALFVFVQARMDAMQGEINTLVEEKVNLQDDIYWRNRSNPLVLALIEETEEEVEVDAQERAWNDLSQLAQERVQISLGQGLEWDEYMFRESSALSELANALVNFGVGSLSQSSRETLRELLAKLDGSYWQEQNHDD